MKREQKKPIGEAVTRKLKKPTTNNAAPAPATQRLITGPSIGGATIGAATSAYRVGKTIGVVGSFGGATLAAPALITVGLITFLGLTVLKLLGDRNETKAD